jgi:hypothetical protein
MTANKARSGAQPSLTMDWRRVQLTLFGRYLALQAQVECDTTPAEAWAEYARIVEVLLRLEPRLAGAGEEGKAVLTTAEMAAKLGITVKTLLEWKSEGRIRPTFAKGKVLKWRLTDAVGR